MRLAEQEVLAGLAHGASLAAIVLLVGIVAFATLVWLPASREVGAGGEAVLLFVRLAWALFGLLVAAGLAEVSLYTVRASGEPLGFGIFWQALVETRVGGILLARTSLGLLTAVAATVAALRFPPFWWAATAIGCGSLLTLTQLSHAAAEGSFLPFFADWLHASAGTAWMGGLLGFCALLLGPLRGETAGNRKELLVRAVPRFSLVATASVATLALTGAYASLIHLTGPSDLVSTPYGRALVLKLGLVALMLPIGAANLLGRGREPLGRRVGLELALASGVFVATGYLTSLPPP